MSTNDDAPTSADSATTDPTVIDQPVPEVEVALIAFRGGPRDSTTGLLSHDVVSFQADTGETYTRSDQQEGNFRIYTFTPPEGGTPDPVRVSAGVDIESKLNADLAALQTDVAVVEDTPAA